MLLDDMQNIIDEYHLIGWGIGCIVIAAILTFFFKDIVKRIKGVRHLFLLTNCFLVI